MAAPLGAGGAVRPRGPAGGFRVAFREGPGASVGAGAGTPAAPAGVRREGPGPGLRGSPPGALSGERLRRPVTGGRPRGGAGPAGPRPRGGAARDVRKPLPDALGAPRSPGGEGKRKDVCVGVSEEDGAGGTGRTEKAARGGHGEGGVEQGERRAAREGGDLRERCGDGGGGRRGAAQEAAGGVIRPGAVPGGGLGGGRDAGGPVMSGMVVGRCGSAVSGMNGLAPVACMANMAGRGRNGRRGGRNRRVPGRWGGIDATEERGPQGGQAPGRGEEGTRQQGCHENALPHAGKLAQGSEGCQCGRPEAAAAAAGGRGRSQEPVPAGVDGARGKRERAPRLQGGGEGGIAG
jgi:hypothetical protein